MAFRNDTKPNIHPTTKTHSCAANEKPKNNPSTQNAFVESNDARGNAVRAIDALSSFLVLFEWCWTGFLSQTRDDHSSNITFFFFFKDFVCARPIFLVYNARGQSATHFQVDDAQRDQKNARDPSVPFILNSHGNRTKKKKSLVRKKSHKDMITANVGIDIFGI